MNDVLKALPYALAVTWLLALCACPVEDEANCAAVAVDENAAVTEVRAICAPLAAEGIFCTGQQDIRLAWSSGDTVFWSVVRCAENIELCRFAIWHEIGHVQLGDNEHLADCYAADRATAADTAAAFCFFNTTTIVGGPDAAHGSGDSRAERIAGCQR